MNELQTWMQELYGTDNKIKAKELIEEQLAGDTPYSGPEGWFRMSFPYYAPDPSLPPLPTPEDVEKFRPPGKEPYQVGKSASDGWLYRMDKVYAVKFSPGKIPFLFQVIR